MMKTLNRVGRVARFAMCLCKVRPKLTPAGQAHLEALLSGVVASYQAKNDQPPDSAIERKLRSNCARYVACLLVDSESSFEARRPLLFYSTSVTLQRIRRVSGLSWSELEDAWQSFSDWRAQHYSQLLPKETWRAFNCLLKQANRS